MDVELIIVGVAVLAAALAMTRRAVGKVRALRVNAVPRLRCALRAVKAAGRRRRTRTPPLRFAVWTRIGERVGASPAHHTVSVAVSDDGSTTCVVLLKRPDKTEG